MLIISHASRAQYMPVGQGHTYETQEHHKTLRHKGSRNHRRQSDRKQPGPETPGTPGTLDTRNTRHQE